MDLIDTHCHLDAQEFDHDRDIVLEQCRLAGVRRLLVPATGFNNWQSVVDICRKNPGMAPALGLHPMFMSEHLPRHISELGFQVESVRPVAVGEIGLDFQVRDASHTTQITLLMQQLKIAQNANLPVILHVRKAHEQMLKCLSDSPVCGGIVHAFNGSFEQAKRYLDLGFKLGFGGMISFPGATRLRKLAENLPIEAIVMETDAPDMPGLGHQRQRNSPTFLPEYAAALAAIRSVSIEEIARDTSENAIAVLGLEAIRNARWALP